MSLKEFQDNYNAFAEMVKNMQAPNEQLGTLINRYVEQNITILNEVFHASIDNLRRLQAAKNPNDVICTQARLTHEMSQKLTLSAQRFLNSSLGHITDYNEWLKAHCDMSTD